MLLIARVFNCVDLLLPVAAAFSSKDIFLTLGTTGATQSEAINAKLRFSGVSFSDAATTCAVYSAWKQVNAGIPPSIPVDMSFLSTDALSIIDQNCAQLASNLEALNIRQPDLNSNIFSFTAAETLKNDIQAFAMLSAVVCAGFFPNVAIHKQKKSLFIPGAGTAFFHPNSVNYHRNGFVGHNGGPLFPYFVYEEITRSQIQMSSETSNSGLVNIRFTTMVSPLTLILFGGNMALHPIPSTKPASRLPSFLMGSSASERSNTTPTYEEAEIRLVNGAIVFKTSYKAALELEWLHNSVKTIIHNIMSDTNYVLSDKELQVIRVAGYLIRNDWYKTAVASSHSNNNNDNRSSGNSNSGNTYDSSEDTNDTYEYNSYN